MTVGYLANYWKEFIEDTIYEYEYNISEFLKGVIKKQDEGKKRCEYCYYIRMKRATEVATEKGFDYFTTTLLTSTNQDHNLIKSICEEFSTKYNIKFYYEDFRVGKKEAYKISKELQLYRQNYCGCIFSELERYNL